MEDADIPRRGRRYDENQYALLFEYLSMEKKEGENK